MIISAQIQSMTMTGIKLVILMFLWIQLIECDHIQAPEELQIKVPNLGRVILSWRPSLMASALNRSIKYEVKIKTPDTEEDWFFTHHTNATRLLAVHRGLYADVRAILMEDKQNVSRSEWVRQELPPFPGAKGTAVTNLTCHIKTDEFLKTSLTCSWTAGINAPADTQYYLYYSYKKRIEKCYSNSQGENSVACQFPLEQLISSLPGKFLVHINGSSKSLQIQGFQHMYIAEHMETINPPRNMSLSEGGDTKNLSWDKPYSLFPGYFEYEVMIWNLETGSNKTQIVKVPMLQNGKLQPPWTNHMMKVRAIRKGIFTNKDLYSNWTEPFHVENTVEDKINIYLIAGFACLTVTGLVLIYVCSRFQLLGKMFPPIPKPKEALKEFLTPQKVDIVSFHLVNEPEVICFIEEMRDIENPDRRPLNSIPSGFKHKIPQT
ncbi:hypothetical protein XENTR_v10012697 [Xenopus tropicalis]|uniref:Il5ra protein n=1 Tax=Xenopus tropicalis TaxID=8364 RepID=B1H2M2_XENTR|nr:interleukin-5 receptor subunit alpha precursor [Xenopus tropicalis]XP_012816040.1 interleukin-5 receptor subunit alpha isoform X1 [Xenopus tropicalis]XP_012816042.1 interleukin-5 receptor subunit alpha isoform X1 [Xenopus tropicalis]XP_012816043.1 interleukin-5 receptor subunit alpha isoform X1 [Xenopus tropicalis]AAI61054.1 il5ra protein [Xenopus tropicalis]KAE8612051.1 hypothetical protein XENTR_v10012697 [Xenopus tropicalis]KAE8612052.1 hypothetical protein XENTR_v10012697 [Xenopus trop|eukprot:XP_012816040.1 PREDICTED: interleukin-5 receptor subunit alpha isoform X1 [Xenopus tropicalis]